MLWCSPRCQGEAPSCVGEEGGRRECLWRESSFSGGPCSHRGHSVAWRRREGGVGGASCRRAHPAGGRDPVFLALGPHGGGVVAGAPPPVQHGREELCTHKLHVPLLDRKEVRGDACDDADGPAGNEEEAVSAWRCRVRDVVLLGQARSLGPDRGLPRDGQGQGGSHAAQARLESPDRCLNGRAGVASVRKRVVDCEGRSG